MPKNKTIKLRLDERKIDPSRFQERKFIIRIMMMQRATHGDKVNLATKEAI